MRKSIHDLIRSIAWSVTGRRAARCLGFWVLWHTYGGHRPLVAAGIYSDRGVWQARADFRAMFKVEVQRFYPEIAVQFTSEQAPTND